MIKKSLTQASVKKHLIYTVNQLWGDRNPEVLTDLLLSKTKSKYKRRAEPLFVFAVTPRAGVRLGGQRRKCALEVMLKVNDNIRLKLLTLFCVWMISTYSSHN